MDPRVSDLDWRREMPHEKKTCQPAKEQSAGAVAAAEPLETSSLAVYLESKSPATPFELVM